MGEAQRNPSACKTRHVMGYTMRHPSYAFVSVKELVALAKAQPGQLNFGSAGNGSGNHLAIEQLMSLAGIEMNHVPYKGGVLALNALMAGEIDVVFGPMITIMQQLKSGRIRAMAVSTSKRSALLPNLPPPPKPALPVMKPPTGRAFWCPPPHRAPSLSGSMRPSTLACRGLMCGSGWWRWERSR